MGAMPYVVIRRRSVRNGIISGKQLAFEVRMAGLHTGIHDRYNDLFAAFGQIPALFGFDSRQIPLVCGEQQIIGCNYCCSGIFTHGIIG
ncbi:hypothetical protein D3C79_1012290 [compost metagenome]